MKRLTLILVMFSIAQVIYSVGCNNIDTPVREGSESLEQGGVLLIQCDHNEILDTEPLLLCIDGGTGDIVWSVEPVTHGSFAPETGDEVLFIPADISTNAAVTITAEDQGGNKGSLNVALIDEGLPPSIGDVIINEIAWSGTLTSAYDEYIELKNTNNRPFYLNNWRILNAAGSGTPLSFSGRIEAESVFLIANYTEGSDKTAITCSIHYVSASLSISNSTFGPFVLTDQSGIIMDSVGDGASYTQGINTAETRSSLSRYTWSSDTSWTTDSWYTESQSVNLHDGTLGTPGAQNSDVPFYTGPGEQDALAILTEYAVDPADSIGEDWVEILITRSGSLKNFVVSDLDGQDLSITFGRELQCAEGDYVLIVWHEYDEGYDFEANGYIIDDGVIYIPENPPTGTKDQIVLLCAGAFLDGLCYYTEGNDFFDNDEQVMRDYGWGGDPIPGKYGARRLIGDGQYEQAMDASSWDTGADATPGSAN